MSQSLNVNGVTYPFPDVNGENWGQQVTSWAVAVSANTLQKKGGSFTLTAETDFGGSFGLKALSYKSQGANASSVGVLRLANGESIAWRNSTNSADLELKPGTDGLLTYGGVDLVDVSSTQTLTNKTLSSPSIGGLTASKVLQSSPLGALEASSISATELSYLSGVNSALLGKDQAGTLTAKTINAPDNTLTNIADTNISASAAIAYSKLALTGGVVNADINASAAIVYSKLALSNSIVNADINASAAIAYSKLSLGSSIVNADINASAAIAYSKLNLSASVVNADISASAAIAYSKLSLGSSIVNADISSSAAIARSKIAVGTASHVLVNDGSGNLSSEAQLSSTKGGTGVSNAGTLTYGANNVTLTTSGVTALTLPSSGTLVTLSGTEVLSNKSFSDAVLHAEVATPSTPASGYVKIYPKSDHKVYKLDSTGAEVEIGSGASSSGGNGINFISANPDAESGTTGYSRFDDGAVSLPVDGTGGSPNAAFTFTRTTTNPIYKTGSFLITKDAVNRQGHGVSYDFTIDYGFKAKVLQIDFLYEIASGTYADDDQICYILDVTNSTLIQPSQYKIKNVVTGLVSKFVATFQTSSNSVSYRLIFMTASTSASAYALKLDQISVGPQLTSVGAYIGPVTSFTPTTSGTGLGTISAATGFWQRRGELVKVWGEFLSGSTAAATAVRINLPPGMSANASPTIAQVVGTMNTAASNTSGNLNAGLLCLMAGVTSYVSLTNVADGATKNLAETTGNIIGNNFRVSFEFEVPIQGWGTSQILSSDAGDSRLVEAKYTNATTAITSGAIPIFSTKKTDTLGAYNTTDGKYYVQVPGRMKVFGYFKTGSVAWTAADVCAVNLNKNGVLDTTIGFLRVLVSSTTSHGILFSGEVDCLAGDNIYITIGTDRNFTLPGGTDTWICFERMSTGNQQIAASESVVEIYETNAGQSIPNNTVTIIDFEDKVKSSHGQITTGAAWKMTAQAAGDFDVNASISFDNITNFGVGETVDLRIYKNGSLYKRKIHTFLAAGGAYDFSMDIFVCVPMIAGDYVDCRVYQSSGAAATLVATAAFNRMEIRKR